MKPLPLLLLVGAGVFGVWAWTRQSEAAKLQYVIKKVSTDNSSLSILVLVSNNSSKKFTQTNLTGNILLNGNILSSISDSDPVDIEPNTVTPIAWQLQPDLSASDSDARKLLSGSAGVSQEIRLKGNVSISGTTLPIDLLYKTV
jgi:hypothetical protein